MGARSIAAISFSLSLLLIQLNVASPRVVATMGTIPGRDPTESIASLLGQEPALDAIHVTLGGIYWLGLSAPPEPSVQLLSAVRAGAGRAHLHRVNVSEDVGPACKYLVTLDLEQAADTIVVILDDDTAYPINFVATLVAALGQLGTGHAVGGSGALFVERGVPAHRVCRGSANRSCDDQVLPACTAPSRGAGAAAVFAYGLRRGCARRADVLQGFSGIAMRRGDVNASRLSALVREAPSYLRASDDLLLASELALGGVRRWLVGTPAPRFTPAARVHTINGRRVQCRGGKRVPHLDLVYQLGIAWLQRRHGLWGHVNMSSVAHDDGGAASLQQRLLEDCYHFDRGRHTTTAGTPAQGTKPPMAPSGKASSGDAGRRVPPPSPGQSVANATSASEMGMHRKLSHWRGRSPFGAVHRLVT